MTFQAEPIFLIEIGKERKAEDRKGKKRKLLYHLWIVLITNRSDVEIELEGGIYLVKDRKWDHISGNGNVIKGREATESRKRKITSVTYSRLNYIYGVVKLVLRTTSSFYFLLLLFSFLYSSLTWVDKGFHSFTNLIYLEPLFI